MIGQTIGHYEITAKLGQGGMGEVYRATDTRLNREVALKILPQLFAQDAQRMGRFEREAQVLASLNHPNIASIYGLEETNGTKALAMELVEGEDLSEPIARGPIPVDEALPIALQIAEALEDAHGKGIIHRDLKPANIKLTPEGRVKVLDFGLAKAFDDPLTDSQSSSGLSRSPTLSIAATEAGVILGTASYMAPEQAIGRAVTKQADIWAFGVILFEMLKGDRPFGGETTSEILAAVIKDEPDFSFLRPKHPIQVQRLLRRCLKKDPQERLRDIGDALLDLKEFNSSEILQTLTPSWYSRARNLIPWFLLAALSLVAVQLWTDRDIRPLPEAPIRRFAIDLPWQKVSNWTDFIVALSPTGTHLAYLGRQDNDVDAYVQPLDSLAALPLIEARDVFEMAFSPDGEWLAVVDQYGIRKASIHGGEAQSILRSEGKLFVARGLSWDPAGNILVGHPSGLLRIPGSGGPVIQLSKIDTSAGETGHFDPFPLPGGRHILMTVTKQDRSELAIFDLEEEAHSILPLFGSRPIYVGSHIVFRQGASVFAAYFQLEDLTLTSEAFPVLEGVWDGPFIAEDGTMLYIPERGSSNARLVWVNRNGHPTPIPGERLNYSHLALGPGRRALLNIGQDLYLREIDRGTRRLLSDNAAFPIWTTDGKWALFWAKTQGKAGLWRQPADGSAGPEFLFESETLLVPSSWNALTGDLAFFDVMSDIRILSSDGTAKPLLAGPYNEVSGRFSPDGRWLAYASDETGSYQVYVVPYPGPGPKVAISIDGGMSPVWSSDGQELFYRRGGKVLSASLTFSPSLSARRPTLLFDGPYTLDLLGHQRYDVAADGEFLMVENSDDFRIVLVQNWVKELTQLTRSVTGR